MGSHHATIAHLSSHFHMPCACRLMQCWSLRPARVWEATSWWVALLCMLRYAMLCMLRCACCAMLRCAVLCRTLLCEAVTPVAASLCFWRKAVSNFWSQRDTLPAVHAVLR